MSSELPDGKNKKMVGRVSAVLAIVWVAVLGAQTIPPDGPRYVGGTNLVRPDNYREWTFLSSGLSMTYDPLVGDSLPGPQLFQNVFVNPVSYWSFLETGIWPD